MLDDFFIRAMIAGFLVAFATGPLGCFVVWRRMAYFGDATAHAAILGVALSLAFSISIFIGVMAAAVTLAVAVTLASQRGHPLDTMLGVLAHASLAFGLVALSLLSGIRVDLSSYLFGDILAVSKGDLAVIGLGSLAVLSMIYTRWSALLAATLTPDLAVAGNLKPGREQMILTVTLAIAVAVSIKVLGALLISAMLIIPAAAARPMVRTPEAMAAVATGIGLLSVFAGLEASLIWDTPSGPSIICAATIFFVVGAVVGSVRSGRA